jgi:predicted TIM-barrel enzyme
LSERHELYLGIRLGLNSVSSAQDLTDIVRAVKEGGGDGVMFYNYSESPMTTLNWIKPALASVR